MAGPWMWSAHLVPALAQPAYLLPSESVCGGTSGVHVAPKWNAKGQIIHSSHSADELTVIVRDPALQLVWIRNDIGERNPLQAAHLLEIDKAAVVPVHVRK
jgi:hypothetical protein